MKSYTETIKRLKDYADQVSITDGLSRATYELDRLERTTAREKQALQTARLVVLLSACRKAAARPRKVEGDDAIRERFNLDEIERLDKEVAVRVRKLILAGETGITRHGLQVWARRTVKAAEAKPTARRTAPASARPAAKSVSSSTQRASERFAKLLTRYGLTARKGTGEVGFDVQCGCRYRARGNTFVRTRRCRTACTAPGTLSWEAVEQGIARAARR